ncbi:PHD finger protein MBD-R2 [Rhynchophorus ferrugineus]|uniref:PHD finger protein MBD-R2 n=1 Tax=Rhynchophorus ferrugineus TaxID=354439 RepID=UPI003FCDE266
MGRKCTVQNCKSDSTRPEHVGVTFHKVPHHSDVRPKWISLCRISEDKSNAKVLYVCSRHFLRADFCSFKGKKYMLRQGVLPSVFPWDKSKLDAIKAEVTTKKEVEIPKKKEKKNKEKSKAENVSISKKDYDTTSESDESKIESDNLPKTDNSIQADEKDNPNADIKEETDAFDQHQRSQSTSAPTSPMIFLINSKIEVLDNNVWYTAKINEVDYEESEILIHFEHYSNKYDEWISMSSPRLRPIQPKLTEKYELGEKCMAISNDTKKFPATITNIIDTETYEVRFQDGLNQTIKVDKISKISKTKPAQASPLFEPIKSSKQERRDKKRKLNVAELFGKRCRSSHTEEKKMKTPSTSQPTEESTSSAPDQKAIPIADSSMNLSDQWLPTFENGKPVGKDSKIESIDGVRKSVIVPDPRIPSNWERHLAQRSHGTSAGKWDTIFISPDNKKFRNKSEIKVYLEQNSNVDVSLDVFDFSIYRNGHKRKSIKHKSKTDNQAEPNEEPVKEEPVNNEEVSTPTVNLKIIFEDDSYKCPIEGCGKNFRRENLALMHVKHYHSEYTKYLDSTPNVADLAYARTVGENLDKSPGIVKPGTPKAAIDKTPVSAKVSKAAHMPAAEPKTPGNNSPNPEAKTRDAEIIKLLNQKVAEPDKDIQPLPSGLPSSMYPDIKLKDLLSKTEEIPHKDELNIKTLCASRPTHGIKTLLPVRSSQVSMENHEEKIIKRKRPPSDSLDTHKGKQPRHSTVSPPKSDHNQPTQQPPPPQKHPVASNQSSNSQSPRSDISAIPSAFDLAPPVGLRTSQPPPAVTPFDGVIIEGGKIIKLERMKQEEIINCTCGYTEEDGLMIQCELCLCWQHAHCNNIQKESEVPEKYICYICQHPVKERRSMKYLHDQDWLKQGTLPVASYHTKDDDELRKRFEKLKKCHDLTGGVHELRDYMHTLAYKLKIAEAKNHPKLYLWSKPWEKPKLPEKANVKDEESADSKVKIENMDHQYLKNEMAVEKQENQNDSMLMMILKDNKEDVPMLNDHNSLAPIIPKPEAAIDSDDCRLNLLDHIAHAESLIEERLDNFERQFAELEEGMNLEDEEGYPKTRQTLQLLMRDLDTLKKFSEWPIV